MLPVCSAPNHNLCNLRISLCVLGRRSPAAAGGEMGRPVRHSVGVRDGGGSLLCGELFLRFLRFFAAIGSVMSVPVWFVSEGYGKPVPRVDTHHGEVEIHEFLFGENAGGLGVNLIRQMMRRD
jgi:hypothetical protein